MLMKIPQEIIDKHFVSSNTVRGAGRTPKYLLFANDTSSGRPWCWGSDDLNFAISLAKTICEDTGQDVQITQLVGTVQVEKPKVEYVSATPDMSITPTQP
jgi:hypothetical protein